MIHSSWCRGVALFLAILSIGVCCEGSAHKSPRQWAFVRLDFARDEKVDQLNAFLDRIHGLAIRAAHDDVLIEFFDVLSTCERMSPAERSPTELARRMAAFRAAIKDYYIENYLAFYDMLLVSDEGRVLYSLRKEIPDGRLLAEELPPESPLATCLASHPREERFVDYHEYTPSQEPAAFFVEPVEREGQRIGWCVLQCAVNKINSIFTGSERLGATGETFLVNTDGYMLTESNFRGDSTILRTRLDDRNIQAKFREGKGHRRVIDYRGFPAISSFEVYEFLGARWLIVAKVDESQIVTEHFAEHRDYYGQHILAKLADASPGESKPPLPPPDRKVIRVDMDEFVRATHDEILQTLGVSTCTALVATYPGHFGYLAHISPRDRIYGANGGNLLGHVTKRIKTYDIYKCERRRVQFLIVANHTQSMPNIINRLVDEGFLLSQISIIYNPTSRCANVIYDYSTDNVSVHWLPRQPSAGECIHHAGDAHNVGEIVKELLGG